MVKSVIIPTRILNIKSLRLFLNLVQVLLTFLWQWTCLKNRLLINTVKLVWLSVVLPIAHVQVVLNIKLSDLEQ